MSNTWTDPTDTTPTSSAPDVVHAGFFKRWAALFLDQLILGVAYYAVVLVVFLLVAAITGISGLATFDSDEPPAWVILAYLGTLAGYYIAAGLYYTLMESSSRQATVGKMALGIKVVDRKGQRLSFAHAVGRWLAASLSYITLYIGFLMAAFTAEKQALHDMLAGTFVVDRWAYTDQPERQARGLHGCVIAFAIGMLLFITLVVLGIVAAIALPAYQQYTARSQFHQIDASLQPLITQVETHVKLHDQCPDNNSAGFGAPESYADTGLSRIVVGEFEAGFCGISIWMPPLQGSVERQFLAEFDAEEGVWYCTNKAGDLPSPDWCH